jgi:DNA-binding NarL/FixJ family response regulator
MRAMHILVADDQAQVRSALKLLLEDEERLNVQAEAQDARSLLAQFEQERVEMILLDWELPGQQRPADLIRQLRTLCPQVVIVAMSSHPEAQGAALAAGANAFVSKANPPEYLLMTLRSFCPNGDDPLTDSPESGQTPEA